MKKQSIFDVISSIFVILLFLFTFFVLPFLLKHRDEEEKRNKFEKKRERVMKKIEEHKTNYENLK